METTPQPQIKVKQLHAQHVLRFCPLAHVQQGGHTLTQYTFYALLTDIVTLFS